MINNQEVLSFLELGIIPAQDYRYYSYNKKRGCIKILLRQCVTLNRE